MFEVDIEKAISELTVQEKAALTAGIDFWHTKAIPRLKIPSLRFSDGPNGVRGTRFFNGVPAACLPCSTALGATWDVQLIEKLGILLGEESRAKGAHVLLAPTINIQRSPLGGRGFESFSEDAVLSGTLAGHYVRGVQSQGVGATLKHFVCNDQEHERMAVDTLVTPRALREIYLLPFQQALRICPETSCFMTAYNKINGVHVSESKNIIEGILREEWGFKGLVMSDWFGTYSSSDAINAGLDLEMPGPTRWRGEILAHAVNSRKVADHVLDERVRNVLRLVNYADKSGIPEGAEEKGLNREEDKALLRRAAAESVVLLKNENNILPLDKNKPVTVIGPNSKVAAYCGGGSAALLPYYAVTPFDGVSAASKGEITFSQGVYAHQDLPLLGPLMKNPDGKKGFRFKVYNEPPSDKERKPIDTLDLIYSSGHMPDYVNPKIKSPTFYADMVGTYTPEEDGIYDFGVTVCGTGQLFIDDELIVDNTKNQKAGTAFFGTATIEVRASKELKAGKTYQVLFQFGSWPTSDMDLKGTVAFGHGAFRFGCCRQIKQEDSIAHAVEAAKKSDQVVLFAGLTSEWETEGHDRDHMDLPPGSDELIARVVEANPSTVVVIQSGTPITMPWASKTNALLQAWFGGNETGNGIADVLFGDVNPSGKLPLSFPVRLQDNPSYLNFGSEKGRVLYGEDVYVGYRYYEKIQLAPQFAFGYGLSYTTFSRTDLKLSVNDENVTASLTVKNTGSVSGAEIVQLWIIPAKDSSIARPVRELKGFTKVDLKAGEEKTVEINVSKKLATSFWDEIRNSWASEKGEYHVQITGTGDLQLEDTFEIEKTVYWKGL